MSPRSKLSRLFRRMRSTLTYYREETILLSEHPRGHYYSPLPNPNEGALHAAAAILRNPQIELPGIDLKIAEQKELLLKMAAIYREFDWPPQRCPERRFHFDQGWFKYADSISLYSILRLFRPKQVIEVGSGFSSVLMLDVNQRFLERTAHFTFIEPLSRSTGGSPAGGRSANSKAHQTTGSNRRS